ncbi:Gag-Pro-Pol polyprotein [Dictyocoela muelleri]|nr:Gag-Pro-Pol polyprotein [Dictyocoela muelleri]
MLIMEEYNYELHYIKGQNNVYADFLSRNFLIKKDYINTNDPYELDYSVIKELRNTNSDIKRKEILIKIHEIMFHPGVHKFYGTLKRYLNIKKLKETIIKICKSCKICMEEKSFKNMSGNITNDYHVYNINDMIAVDIKGPIAMKHYKYFKNIKKTQFYILLITDLFSRYTKGKIIYNITSKNICMAIENTCFKVYRTPKNCISDNVRQFTSNAFTTLLKTYEIKHIKTAPYNPTGNSIVERMNQELGIILRVVRGKNVREIYKGIEMRINSTINMTTGYPPKEIFLSTSIFKNFDKKINVYKDEIISRIKSKSSKYANKINSNCKRHIYKPNDKVFMRNHSPDKIEKNGWDLIMSSNFKKNLNNIYINKKGKNLKVYIKNIRPFSGGERM